MSNYTHTCEVCGRIHVPDPCCFGCPCGAAYPPSMDDIREAIRLMRIRLESGQGLAHQAMTRLSLVMSEALLAECDRLRGEMAALRWSEWDERAESATEIRWDTR